MLDVSPIGENLIRQGIDQPAPAESFPAVGIGELGKKQTRTVQPDRLSQ